MWDDCDYAGQPLDSSDQTEEEEKWRRVLSMLGRYQDQRTDASERRDDYPVEACCSGLS